MYMAVRLYALEEKVDRINLSIEILPPLKSPLKFVYRRMHLLSILNCTRRPHTLDSINSSNTMACYHVAVPCAQV